MDWYVYLWFYPTGVPLYVGLGRWRTVKKRQRYEDHLVGSRNRQLAAAFRRYGYDLPIVIIRDGLTSVEAKALEVVLIAAIGRTDLKTGSLANRTDGGDGLINASDEILERIGNYILVSLALCVGLVALCGGSGFIATTPAIKVSATAWGMVSDKGLPITINDTNSTPRPATIDQPAISERRVLRSYSFSSVGSSAIAVFCFPRFRPSRPLVVAAFLLLAAYGGLLVWLSARLIGVF